MLPTLPRSYMRLWALYLEGLRFRSVDELAKFISGFPSLQEFTSQRLVFEDASPLTYTRRLQRLRLSKCDIRQSDGLSPFTLTSLAFALQGIHAVAQADMQTWNTAINTLAESMPKGPAMGLLAYSLSRTRDFMCFQLSATQDMASGLGTLHDFSVYVSIHTPAGGPPAIDIAVELHHSSLWRTFAWDTLQAVIHPTSAHTLSILVSSPPNNDDVELLCSLLCGERLRWALDAGKLSLKRYSYGDPNAPFTIILTASDILDAAAQLTVRGAHRELEVQVYAEYLMYGNGTSMAEFMSKRRQEMASKKSEPP